MPEKCPCWCHMNPQPQYDSYRDYFETHSQQCGGPYSSDEEPKYSCPGLDIVGVADASQD